METQVDDTDVKHNSEVIVDDEDTRKEDTYEKGSIYPYGMPEEVDVTEDHFSVFEWVRKLKKGQLILDPEFQRNLVWKKDQKSKFIESILLNMPLPPLYVNQNKEGEYIIVDGLQRTSTLAEFMKKNGFKLEDLQVLNNLNGLGFDDFKDDLEKLKTKIEDGKLLVYVIKPSVPIAMVYDIFNRINAAGTQLNRQEIRNCIFGGKATKLLNELAIETYFRKAIGEGISPKRMKDREAILRYLAFRIFDYTTDYKNNMDDFLEKTLKTINGMGDEEINELKQDFARVMKLTYEFFGDTNFRLSTDSTRGRINIALLESISCFFSITPDEFLKRNRRRILENYAKLFDDEAFIDAIRASTNTKSKVETRFKLAQKILGNTQC